MRVKRKRGRPRKRLLELVSPQTLDQQNLNQQQQNPNLNQSAASSGPSSEFEAAAAAIEAKAAPSDAPAEALAAPDLMQQMAQKFVAGLCSEDQVRKYIDVPFNAASVLAKQDALKLQEWEKEIWVPAVVACGQRYGPDLLKQTDKPELMMLAMAAVTYAVRVSLQWERKPKTESQTDSLPAVTTTEVSAGSLVC